VWDVGHQAYAHKILTGRAGRFHTLRKLEGVSGFPRRDESDYDAFGTGHASTAVSAALGMAIARDRRGSDEKVIAVFGDGSLTGGLCYEALNNAGHIAKNLLLILNDNEMSISRNVGAISTYLNRIITSPTYNRARHDMQMLVQKIPTIGKKMFDTARRLEESLKNLVSPGMIFEELGIRYFGPVNGHDIEALIDILNRIKNIDRPCILHVLTRKGKGYEHAEKHPEYFHGTSPFDVSTGMPRKAANGPSYSDVFGRAVVTCAKRDPSIVAITAAMCYGTGLYEFAQLFPERFFDVGIAESHAVTFAAGLAANGCHPVVGIYSTFLQRAYDQLVHDVCIQKLPVVFAIDRGGIVGADGATHSGQFAFSFLRHIPNLVVMAPSSGDELREMLSFSFALKQPVAIVYPKGGVDSRGSKAGTAPIELGKAVTVTDGSDLALISIGTMLNTACNVARRLAEKGISAKVINARFVKPLDTVVLRETAASIKKLVTIEENAVQGGFGSAVLEELSRIGAPDAELLCIGIRDEFIEHGSTDELRRSIGLDEESITQCILKRFRPGRT
jgi:1-deoxy-D-xylulose-5-phosphate synthase